MGTLRARLCSPRRYGCHGPSRPDEGGRDARCAGESLHARTRLEEPLTRCSLILPRVTAPWIPVTSLRRRTAASRRRAIRPASSTVPSSGRLVQLQQADAAGADLRRSGDRLLLGRLPQAEAGARRRPEPRRARATCSSATQIARPMIGKQRATASCRFLVSLFFFIWIMNLMEIIPVAQFPATVDDRVPGRRSMLMVYVTYTYQGIKHQGLGGYFRNMIPSGVPSADPVHPGAGGDPAVPHRPAVHAGGPAVREHVRRATSCCWSSRSRPGTCSAPASACSSARPRSS